MTDPAFVLLAYGVVVGGLAAYVRSIGQRITAARRVAGSIETQRLKPTARALERAQDPQSPEGGR